jgi:hypothetical protein
VDPGLHIKQSNPFGTAIQCGFKECFSITHRFFPSGRGCAALEEPGHTSAREPPSALSADCSQGITWPVWK